MSMNVHITATRNASTVKKNGEVINFIDRIDFACWQTPTKVSYEIEQAGPLNEQIAAYKKWVMKTGISYTVPVFPDHDIWKEGQAIGVLEVNEHQEHCINLDQWIEESDNNGYTVELFVI